MASLNQINNFMEKWGMDGVYFTTNPVKLNDEHYGNKYFICYHNTNNILIYGKTYVEILEGLEEYINENYKINVWDGVKWVNKTLEFFNNVDNIHLIEEAHINWDFLKVYYKDGSIKCYDNIHGSWGNSTVSL